MRGTQSLKRRGPVRQPKKKFVIFSEGQNTEPDYFEALRRHAFGALVDLEIIEGVGVPATIAEKACARAKLKKNKRLRSSFEENDEIWAVFDRDEHPNFEASIVRCKAANVGTAQSDPCFELWMILHYQEYDRPDDRHAVQKKFASICKDYDPKKGKTTDCKKLIGFVEKAEDRAEKQLARRLAESQHILRPYTMVFKLTKSLKEAHNNYVKAAEGKSELK